MSQQFSQKSGLHTVLLFTQHCVHLSRSLSAVCVKVGHGFFIPINLTVCHLPLAYLLQASLHGC